MLLAHATMPSPQERPRQNRRSPARQRVWACASRNRRWPGLSLVASTLIVGVVLAALLWLPPPASPTLAEPAVTQG